MTIPSTKFNLDSEYNSFCCRPKPPLGMGAAVDTGREAKECAAQTETSLCMVQWVPLIESAFSIMQHSNYDAAQIQVWTLHKSRNVIPHTDSMWRGASWTPCRVPSLPHAGSQVGPMQVPKCAPRRVPSLPHAASPLEGSQVNPMQLPKHARPNKSSISAWVSRGRMFELHFNPLGVHGG